MKKFYLSGSLAILVLISACTKNNENNNVNEADQVFMTRMSMSNKTQIAAGQLVISKSDRASIKSFGQMMVTDGTGAQAELEKMAGMLNVNLQDVGTAESQQLISRLNGLSGYSFDTAYIRGQVRAHQQILSVFQKAFNEGNNSTVKGYVHRYIDLITMHYSHADSISRRL